MPSDPLTELTSLATALREPLGATETFALVDAALRRLFGHTAFTVMRYDAARDETERVYSSVPNTFPLSGRKRRKTNGWSERVIDRGEIHLADGAAALARVFDDHAQIAALGCAAVLNIPVRHAGRTLGVLNLLGPAGRFDACDRAIALAVAAFMIPVLSSG
jgi:transcriptional regulator with GAF, ATPase, and Fis domain